MNNLKDKNTNIKETPDYGYDEIRQTTIENDEQTNLTDQPSGSGGVRGTEPCPNGQVRHPVTNECVDPEKLKPRPY